jgi:hypothetical protein
MEVNGQFHVPAALFSEKRSPVLSGPQGLSGRCEERNLAPAGVPTPAVQLAPVAIPANKYIILGNKYLQKFDGETSWKVGTSKTEREISGKVRWVFLNFFFLLSYSFPFLLIIFLFFFQTSVKFMKI